ncbi:MAG: hypothetical protein L3J39_06935 [Verrucomicrobiales bacterium]|nr:hypothetical protein [Verrucomicrobiales bacterium]
MTYKTCALAVESRLFEDWRTLACFVMNWGDEFYTKLAKFWQEKCLESCGAAN